MKLPPQHGVPGRYAAALYMAAVKTDSLAKVEGELSQVASLMSESKDFHAFVADPSVPREVKIDGLNSVLSKMGATDITKNFIGAHTSFFTGTEQRTAHPGAQAAGMFAGGCHSSSPAIAAAAV